MYKIYEFWYSQAMQHYNGETSMSNWSTTSLNEVNQFRLQTQAYRHALEIAMDCALTRDSFLKGLFDPFHQVTRGYFHVKGQQCPAFHVKAKDQDIVTFYVVEE